MNGDRKEASGSKPEVIGLGRPCAFCWLKTGQFEKGLIGLVGNRIAHKSCAKEHDRKLQQEEVPSDTSGLTSNLNSATGMEGAHPN